LPSTHKLPSSVPRAAQSWRWGGTATVHWDFPCSHSLSKVQSLFTQPLQWVSHYKPPRRHIMYPGRHFRLSANKTGGVRASLVLSGTSLQCILWMVIYRKCVRGCLGLYVCVSLSLCVCLSISLFLCVCMYLSVSSLCVCTYM